MSQYDLSESKPKRTGGCSPIAIFFAASLVVASLFIGFIQLTSNQTRLSPRIEFKHVRYEVRTVLPDDREYRFMDLTYTNQTGNVAQEKGRIPWVYEFDALPGQFASISAQNGSDTIGFECAITIDGVEREQAESWGAYKIASCSGSAR